eukprot:15473703-Alexandrium_andersonii.AAC.1
MAISVAQCSWHVDGTWRFDASGAMGSTVQERVAGLSCLRVDARFLRAHLLEHSDKTDFARALRDLPSD